MLFRSGRLFRPAHRGARRRALRSGGRSRQSAALAGHQARRGVVEPELQDRAGSRRHRATLRCPRRRRRTGATAPRRQAGAGHVPRGRAASRLRSRQNGGRGRCHCRSCRRPHRRICTCDRRRSRRPIAGAARSGCGRSGHEPRSDPDLGRTALCVVVHLRRFRSRTRGDARSAVRTGQRLLRRSRRGGVVVYGRSPLPRHVCGGRIQPASDSSGGPHRRERKPRQFSELARARSCDR